MQVLVAAAALLWLAALVAMLLERAADTVVEAAAADACVDEVTAIVPARDEEALLPLCLAALAGQVRPDRVIVVDDESSDGTARVARAAGARVIAGRPPPPGWSGKLWALEQGRAEVSTDYLLLLDADIALAPGTVATLLARMRGGGIAFASLHPAPRLAGFWERLLLPAFAYFFELLYPFRWSNAPRSRVAAASGGCIVAERRAITSIGGFAAIRDALIDDCTLARAVKRAGFGTYIGLTHAARSLRAYPRLADVVAMVERTAYTQLRYSALLLLGCTALMALAFWVPLAGAFHPVAAVRALALAALAAMAASYLPTLRFYRRSPAWVVALPLVGTLYLYMTWRSALRYWRGQRARWKGRVYQAMP